MAFIITTYSNGSLIIVNENSWEIPSAVDSCRNIAQNAPTFQCVNSFVPGA